MEWISDIWNSVEAGRSVYEAVETYTTRWNTLYRLYNRRFAKTD